MRRRRLRRRLRRSTCLLDSAAHQIGLPVGACRRAAPPGGAPPSRQKYRMRCSLCEPYAAGATTQQQVHKWTQASRACARWSCFSCHSERNRSHLSSSSSQSADDFALLARVQWPTTQLRRHNGQLVARHSLSFCRPSVRLSVRLSPGRRRTQIGQLSQTTAAAATNDPTRARARPKT